jgi:ABC-type branched-subunit amino acid transport system ATPase component
VFEVRDLSVREAVRGATLRLHRGDVALLHGEGADAVVRAVAGLQPATTGVVRLHGDDLAGRSPQAVAALGVAYVSAASLPYPDLTVVENLVAGAAAGHVHGRLERADAVLASVPRLADRAGTRAGALGDEDAAVLAVAVALARRPRLLLLDGLSARVGAAYREVRHALRVAAAEEVVTLAAETAEPRDAGEYDVTLALRRGWLRA